MKEIAIQLIEDDIRISSLVKALGELGIDASDLYPNTTDLIFDLAGIDKEKMKTDELNDQYMNWITSGISRFDYGDHSLLRELTTEIYTFLRAV